jgi:hypothetical protein
MAHFLIPLNEGELIIHWRDNPPIGSFGYIHLINVDRNPCFIDISWNRVHEMGF